MEVDESARDILLREGYYSIINGYKDLFIDKEQTTKAGEDRYKVGTTFDEVYRLFEFDRNLRLIMFRYFSIAEATLKTACAYNFSELHDGEKETYLNAANYRNDVKYRKEIDRYFNSIEFWTYQRFDACLSAKIAVKALLSHIVIMRHSIRKTRCAYR